MAESSVSVHRFFSFTISPWVSKLGPMRSLFVITFSHLFVNGFGQSEVRLGLYIFFNFEFYLSQCDCHSILMSSLIWVFISANVVIFYFRVSVDSIDFWLLGLPFRCFICCYARESRLVICWCLCYLIGLFVVALVLLYMCCELYFLDLEVCSVSFKNCIVCIGIFMVIFYVFFCLEDFYCFSHVNGTTFGKFIAGCAFFVDNCYS